jgi:MFS transporter, ACS family, solute carrier family 17 (sodium-dependent inorganic phosphate cotransporter), other
MTLSGFAVNGLDIAPNYASILFGISNFFGSIPGIVSPILTGYIVTNGKESEWKIIFYIAAGVYFFGGIVYWFFASGKPQPWANGKKSLKDSAKI